LKLRDITNSTGKNDSLLIKSMEGLVYTFLLVGASGIIFFASLGVFFIKEKKRYYITINRS
jgi:hypothetical protein